MIVRPNSLDNKLEGILNILNPRFAKDFEISISYFTKIIKILSPHPLFKMKLQASGLLDVLVNQLNATTDQFSLNSALNGLTMVIPNMTTEYLMDSALVEILINKLNTDTLRPRLQNFCINIFDRLAPLLSDENQLGLYRAICQTDPNGTLIYQDIRFDAITKDLWEIRVRNASKDRELSDLEDFRKKLQTQGNTNG